MECLYPDHLENDLPRLEANLARFVPVGAALVQMHFAVLETEAWFIDEHSHFEKISPLLSIDHILASGFDLLGRSGNMWDHPAKTLHNIYRLANKSYKKTGNHIKRTVDALSINDMCSAGRIKSASFDKFVGNLELALFGLTAHRPGRLAGC